MPAPATVASPVVTCLRYRNASAAIEWLVHAFGFEAQRIVPGPADTIVHAQLTLGSGMIMLASVTDTPFSRYMKQPDEVGGVETQSVYLVVADPDQAYRDAQAAGAEILIDIADADYGGRGFRAATRRGISGASARTTLAIAAAQVRGRVTPRWPWYLPPRSRYEVSHTSSLSRNSIWAQPSPA